MIVSSNFTWFQSGGGNSLNGYGLNPGLDAAADKRTRLEPLRTPGVAGVRFRKLDDQFPELTIETAIPCADYTALLAEEDKIAKMVGTVGTLTLTWGAKIRSWPMTTLVSCDCERAGAFVYSGGSSAYSLKITAVVQRHKPSNSNGDKP